MLRIGFLVACLMLAVGSDVAFAEGSPLRSSVPTLVAQANSDDDDRSRTTYRSRRGPGRLIAGGVGLVIAGGAWVVRKMRGE